VIAGMSFSTATLEMRNMSASTFAAESLLGLVFKTGRVARTISSIKFRRAGFCLRHFADELWTAKAAGGACRIK
jgi:hypothetical protein